MTRFNIRVSKCIYNYKTEQIYLSINIHIDVECLVSICISIEDWKDDLMMENSIIKRAVAS